MTDVATGELITIVILVLALLGAGVALARWAKGLSDASRRILGADTKGAGLRDDDDDKDYDQELVEAESMRASSVDRDRTIERLREETAQGRLTFNEFEERMESAQSAKTLGDLSQLTRDLPGEASSAFRKPRRR